MEVAGTLDNLVRRAGGVIVDRGAEHVALHYGSPTGELAVCVRHVGLAIRGDLTAMSVRGRTDSLKALVAQAAGHEVAEGGVVHDGRTWWCLSPGGGSVTLVCPRQDDARLRSILTRHACRFGALRLEEPTGNTVVLSLVGRRAYEVLAVLAGGRVAPDPRWLPPFFDLARDDVHMSVLTVTTAEVRLVVATSEAAQAWRALHRAGRSFGISCVGLDAVRWYELLRRDPPSGHGHRGG